MEIEIQNICDIISDLGMDYEIDNKSTLVKQALSKNPNKLVVATSKKLFYNYDEEHPQRILCMVFNQESFQVVVKNRQVDYVKLIQDNLIDKKLSNAFASGGECCICLKTIKPYTVPPCVTCRSFSCPKCYGKCSYNHAHHCPVCRTWKLDGHMFGTPLRGVISDIGNGNPKGQMTKLIGLLDGKTIVIPRLYQKILLDEDFYCCRNAFTTNYDENGFTPSQMAKMMYKLFKENEQQADNLPMSFYTVRETYAIDKESNKPIVEISHLEWTKDGIIQYENDAWNGEVVLPHIDEVTKNRVLKKVELFEPTKYTIPKKYSELFEKLTQEFPSAFRMTFSVVGMLSSHGMNFDVDENKNIDTMTPELLARSLDMVQKHNDELHVTVRVYNKNGKLLRYMVYKDDDVEYDGFAKLNKNMTKKFYYANYDGLKCSCVGMVFG